MLKDISLLLSALIFVACAPEAKQDSVEIRPDVGSNNTLYFDKVFEDVEYIALETRTECILTLIKRVNYYEHEYYIADGGSHECIFVFDDNGRFKRSIGVKGNGHGEYPMFYDFAIDKERGRIAILSVNSTVYLYDLQGNFLESKSLEIPATWNIAGHKDGFLLTSNHFIAADENDAFLFFHFNNDFQLKSKEEKVIPENPSMASTMAPVLQTDDENISYLDIYTARLFTFSTQSRSTEVFKFVLPDLAPAAIYCNQGKFMESQTKYDFFLNHAFTGDRILTYYVHKGVVMLVISDLEGNILSEGKYVGMIPTLDSHDGDEFTCVISPMDLMSLMAERAAIAGEEPTSIPMAANAENDYFLLKFKLRKDLTDSSK